MKIVLRLICVLALALTLLPAGLVCAGRWAGGSLKLLMLIGTVLWFVGATALARTPPQPRD